MTQMSLGLDLPSKEEMQRLAAVAALPEGDDALIEAVRSLLPSYDAAAMAADTARMDAIHEQIDVIAEKLNGGTRFAIDTREGAYAKLRAALGAPDGTEPMWGQPGRFIVTASGCRCIVTYRGLFGFGGFEIRAVDFDRPFISETGFRSFTGGYSCKRQSGETLAQRTVREIESEKLKLVKLGWFLWRGETKQHFDARPNLEDPAWEPGGWLHEAAKNPPALELGA